MRRKTVLLILLALAPAFARAAQKPKLVVNIVVSQIRYDQIAKFYSKMEDGGIKRFMNNGAVFTDAHYNFMQTITPATLATLTTGADPSTHGIVSENWVDYTTNKTVSLIYDPTVRGLDCDVNVGSYSPENITIPTLGDRLVEHNPESKVVSIAASPVSAVVMAGQGTTAYWMDEGRGNWVSSSAYMPYLPEWVDKYNSMRIPSNYLNYTWYMLKSKSEYVNRTYTLFDFSNESKFRRLVSLDFMRRKSNVKDFPDILRTPAGNTLVTEFFKQMFVNENIGKDSHTDIVNVCYDTPRYIGEMYGSESVEFEDMFYRLDMEISELINFIVSNVGMKEVVVILTSDHGVSDSFDHGVKQRDRFNISHFKVIMNGFMNAQYGSGDWVVDYFDRQLYLNRDLVYSKGLSLEEVQNRVAAFALQFRGVSHVLTSTAMSSSYFSGSYAEKMQKSFYPRRSGDLMINLMPGWIEEKEGVRASSGSMYEYDTHVPLMMIGSYITGMKVLRPVNMRDVAPTLAHIMQISRPIAAEGTTIDEITDLFE